ncbi:hypothetical protein TPA0909_38010 [Streptomyces albus]|nr:hypothetical protein TPA0909_38010 [Streptomyces albus]
MAAGHLATFAGAVVTGSPAAPPDQQVQGRARIATLDDKATGNYLAGLHLRAAMIWINGLAQTTHRSRPDTCSGAVTTHVHGVR